MQRGAVVDLLTSSFKLHGRLRQTRHHTYFHQLWGLLSHPHDRLVTNNDDRIITSLLYKTNCVSRARDGLKIENDIVFSFTRITRAQLSVISGLRAVNRSGQVPALSFDVGDRTQVAEWIFWIWNSSIFLRVNSSINFTWNIIVWGSSENNRWNQQVTRLFFCLCISRAQKCASFSWIEPCLCVMSTKA